MKKISGTFNGTGAALYLCFGFIPDEFKNVCLEAGTQVGAYVDWRRNFRSAEVNNGVLWEADATATVALAATAGVEPYEGGDLMTAVNQTSVNYLGADAIYFGWDNEDYRKNATYGYKSAIIDTWTLGSSGNRTGNFNSDVVATIPRIGEGSVITVRETMGGAVKQALIEALTHDTGSGANEVTLSRPLKSGTIERITGLYSMAPIAIGKVTPAGIKLNNTSIVNVSDEIQYFEACIHDN